MSSQEPSKAVALRNWLIENGGRLHKHAVFVQAGSGHSIVASQDIPADEEIASCPIALAISSSFAREVISRLVNTEGFTWNPRQWISTYLSLHYIVDLKNDPNLAHSPYIDTLPPTDQLSTPLYFSSEELDHFKGTNIYGATQDKLRDWQSEWIHCREDIGKQNAVWSAKFEWSLYLASATYISSRSFPSNIISSTPSLPDLRDETTETEPVLLPGVDSLNHARGQPVSWITHGLADKNLFDCPRMSLVVHKPTSAGLEIFNNYGPKPNAELILGYGFSIHENPDDTIILKVGGAKGEKWTIGRGAKGVEGLWREVLEAVSGDSENPETDYEAILDASGALQEMAEAYLNLLPNLDERIELAVRPHVAVMLRDYVEGQAAILQSILDFAAKKETESIAMAKEVGIDLVIEDD